MAGLAKSARTCTTRKRPAATPRSSWSWKAAARCALGLRRGGRPKTVGLREGTITVIDVYAVISKVRQDTYITYEPLLLLALIYMCLTGILVIAFRYLENRIPTRGA